MTAQHAAGVPPTGDPVSDYAVSHLRTLVPLVWGHLAAWLIGLGIPSGFLDDNKAIGTEVLGLVLSFAWYALWRWAQPRIPAGLSALLLGSSKVPVYAPVGPTPAPVTDAPAGVNPTPTIQPGDPNNPNTPPTTGPVTS